MKRRLFNLAAAASLLLCAATVALWVSSCVVIPRVECRIADSRNGAYTGWMAYGHAGQVGILRIRSRVALSKDETTWLWRMDPIAPELPVWKRLGFRRPSFEYRDHDNPLPAETAHLFWSLHIPCWLLLLSFLAIPSAGWVIRARAARGRNEHRCQKCGYDLRATPRRCPECGTAAGGSAGSLFQRETPRPRAGLS